MTKKHELIVPVCALVVSVFATTLSVVSMYNDHRQKKIDNLVSLYNYLHQAELKDFYWLIQEAKKRDKR